MLHLDMRYIFKWRRRVVILTAILAISAAPSAFAQSTADTAASDVKVSRAVGTIKQVQSDSLTVTPDSGPEVTARMSPATRILRVPPGEKDLKNATPIQVKDLQAGDRVLVRGQESSVDHSISALAIIVMKQADVSAKQEREKEDWQKRGVGGLVEAVDATSGNVTISTGFGGKKTIVIHTTKDTVARRYAAGSVKFDDARPAPLAEIKAGDQLRARGNKSADGSEFTADEIVSGTFRNIAGTITAVDAASGSVTVQDVIRKGPVVIKLSADSQVKKIPPEMAQRIAMRLKAAAGEGGAEAGHSSGSGSAAPSGNAQFPRGGSGMTGERSAGAPDLQRFLGRLPSSKLSDLQKGDAVMIVSTEGKDSGEVTAITMLAGVEPILTASSPRNAAMMLSPWTLGGSSGEGESAQ